MEIREVSILSEDAQSLIALLDRELAGEYAPEHRHPAAFEGFHEAGGVFVIARDGEYENSPRSVCFEKRVRPTLAPQVTEGELQ